MLPQYRSDKRGDIVRPVRLFSRSSFAPLRDERSSSLSFNVKRRLFFSERIENLRP